MFDFQKERRRIENTHWSESVEGNTKSKLMGSKKLKQM